MEKDNMPTPAANPMQRGIVARIIRALRRYLLTGIIITAPVGITVYLTVWFIELVDGWVRVFLPEGYDPQSMLPVTIPGLGLVFAIFVLILVGALATNFFGRALVEFGERVLHTMPIVRTLYSSLKQIFETALSDNSKSFRRAALIEYPRKGLYALVFVTMDSRGEVAQRLEREGDVIGVFLPTTPNPTSGFLLFVPRRDVIFLDMDVESAAKMIVSAGIVEPEPEPVSLISHRDKRKKVS